MAFRIDQPVNVPLAGFPEDIPPEFLTDAMLEQAIGQTPDFGPAPTFQPSRFQRFLEGLSGFNPSQFGPPTSFGGGLAAGLVGGLGRAGSRVAMERQKFEEASARRQALKDQANLAASSDRRKLLASEIKDRREARTKQEAEQAKLDLEHPTVAQLRTKNPKLEPFLKGLGDETRPSQSFITEIEKRTLPESPSERRARESAERAGKTQERAVTAQERANLLAKVQSTDALVDRYNKDPLITSYNQIRSNLQSARAAADQKNGVGDLGLVFAYARALEPSVLNTVREGEVATAREAVGKSEKLKSLLGRFLTGDNFTETGRKRILAAIEGALKSRRPEFDLANKQFEERAKAFEVPTSMFMRTFPEDTVRTLLPIKTTKAPATMRFVAGRGYVPVGR